MSTTECEFNSEGVSGSAGDSVSSLLRLIGRAVEVALVEDWTAESLAQYQATRRGLPVLELPSDSIPPGSVLEKSLMQQLVGPAHSLGELPGNVRDFVASMVSGTKVWEEEGLSCRVVWVSSGQVADPVFIPSDLF